MAVNDGSANAPIGSAQLSSLLDTYGANRPAWKVAGVDYHVGVPTGLALKDPATISMAGVSVDTAHKSITVTGSNVTLDGYDFGGWAVVTSAANTTLTNSNFNGLNPGGPQSSVISGTQTSSNLHIANCTIDGLSGGGHAEFLVEMEGPGLTIEYSWLKNSNSDLIGRHGQDGGDITIQYNLLQQAGMGGSGTHGDYLQVYGPTIDSTHILYNTAVQDGGTTQGFIADNTKSGEFAGNTLIGSVSYWMSVSGPGTDAANLSGAFSTHDNYFDVTKALGFNYPAAGPDDSYSKTSFVHNVNMVTGEVEQDANAPAYTGPTYTAPNSPAPSAPAAPVIASFSGDSGVAGDGITNDTTIELKGAAAANSTVKIYDGSTQIGTTTASSTGSWDYITKVLTDAKHTLTATATNSSGQTSAASAATVVTIDSKAPAAPTIASDTVNSANQVVVTGTAEANSAIKVYDGTTQVGTATTNSSGAWSVTTSALSSGSHLLTAKATDVAGNVSAASTAVDPVIGSGTTGSTGSGTSGSGTSGTGTSGSGTSGSGTSGTGTSGSGTSGSGTSGTGTSGTGTSAPAAPKIATFSKDTGVAGDHITSDNTLTLTGTAAANSTVKVFDGKTQLGTVTADAKGAWHYSTAALPDGKHSFTATDTVSSVTSKASTALDVTVDTAAPDAPVMLSDSTTHNRATVSGTAEAGSLIKLYEGTNLLGTATVASDGGWSVTTPNLKQGSHTFTATATDAAGNTSALSQPIDPPIGPHSGGGTSTVEVANVQHHWGHTATITGTADPNSAIKLFDGTTSVGSVTTGADGKWSFKTSDLSGKSHAFSAEQVDTTGHVVGTSSGEAIVGSGRSDTLTGTKGNDIMAGKWGADTFQFASNFGHDVIKDFAARGPAHDTIEFSKSVFDSFASVLSHAAQSGHDVVIATGSDTLTLKNTQLDKLNSHDFHFA
ncbi:Ig-like domain-containing protein [Bradyrhizobium sp. CCBAU 53415]|uniref:Ig-like domain-containing protein n=1 Tax=Bradyrhizobium sp. CCBAU 53415 TaxID=1325119 RepID=UPI0023068B75|nr:Ig-like domain-containing protein [Bradyrhizobium sp. CCBAU 53415]